MEQISRRTFGRRALAAGAVALGMAPLGMSRSAQGSPLWIDQRQVGPFICQSAFPLVGHDNLLQELAPLEQELIRIFGIEPCRTPVYVHLMASKRQHMDYIKERFPDVPYRQALFIKQNNQASVFAYKNNELAIDVRHECTHALLHANLPMVPLWLDEGLAEYFEVPKEMRFQHNPHLKKVKWDIKTHRVTDLAALEKEDKLENMTAYDYRFSWAWVHYMLHGPEAAHRALLQYLGEIRSRTMPFPLSQRLSEIYPNLGWRFEQHFAQL